MRDRRVVFLLIFVVLFFLLIFFIAKNKAEERVVISGNDNEQVVHEVGDRKFSRITFFNLNIDMRSSLAIPEDWEGKYRVKEGGDKIVFSYVVDPVVSYEIFTLSYVSINKWNTAELGKNKIIEKGGNIVFYELPGALDSSEKFKKDLMMMRNDIEEIMKSFK